MARILIVEDTDELREVLVESLMDQGHRAVGVASGMDAVRIAAQFPIDLLITDVRMAHMDGLDTIAAVREKQPDVPAIIITGFASDDAPVRALELEALDYLYKPFSLKDLYRSVDRVLNPVRETEKHGLLEALSHGYRKIVESVQLSSLTRERERALQAFYVGIRSRKLDQDRALEAWDLLEVLERQRYSLQATGELPKERRSLLEGYQQLRDLIGQLSRGKLPPQGDRQPGQVSRAQFRELHQRISKGQVDWRQAAFAGVLFAIEPELLAYNPELTQLYCEVWGTPPG